MTQNQNKALQALLTQPTKKAAAKAAGISERTLRTYLNDAEFKKAYTETFTEIIASATRKAQQALTPALNVLISVAEDVEAAPAVRISAAKTLLEYGLKFTEFNRLQSNTDAVETETDIVKALRDAYLHQRQ